MSELLAPTIPNHPLLGRTVRHRTLGSAGVVLRATEHRAPPMLRAGRILPYLHVEITDAALKSHHRDGDHVIWSQEDVTHA